MAAMMKLEVSYHSGFSESLVGWAANLLVGRRGSLDCRWFDGAQSHERLLKQHDFGLTAEFFERSCAALAALPSPLQESKEDDASVRVIRATFERGFIERSHTGRRTPSTSEEEFNRIWEELVELVIPAFAGLEIDKGLLTNSLGERLPYP